MSRKYVGIEEGRKRLGDLVTAVQQGAEIIITRNGKPVVQLVRYQEDAMFEIEFAADSQYHANMIVLDALHRGWPTPSEGGRLGYVLTADWASVDAVRTEVRERGLAHYITKRS